MKTTRQILHKVRKTTTFRFTKTSLPTQKYLEDDDEWTPSTRSQRSIRTGGKQRDDSADAPKERPRRKLVFFDEKVLVRRVRAVYEIGGRIDLRDLWYQEDEYKDIVRKAQQLIKRARNSENNDAEKYCPRGLEYVANSMERWRSNLDGREAVLDEQFDQFKKDVFPLDDHRIASVYVPFTQGHRAEAMERARSDAREVALYHPANDTTIGQCTSGANL